MKRWMLIGIHVKLSTAAHGSISAPASDTPPGVIMNDAQESAMNMMPVPITLRPSPRNRWTSG